MANYYSKCRTNYFSVTDENKLEEIINSCKAEGEIQLLKNQEGKYGFCCDCNLYGIGDDDNSYNLLLEELKKILLEDDAIIIINIGYEKMRYLTGGCDVITKNNIEYIDIINVALKTARRMLQNSKFETQISD